MHQIEIGKSVPTISVAWRLPSFIVSLGMLEAVRGSAYVVTDSRTQYVGDAISWLSAPFFGGISFATNSVPLALSFGFFVLVVGMWLTVESSIKITQRTAEPKQQLNTYGKLASGRQHAVHTVVP